MKFSFFLGSALPWDFYGLYSKSMVFALRLLSCCAHAL
nr:MAG TPA: hypothetical protein [Caudoviricetes sp.]